MQVPARAHERLWAAIRSISEKTGRTAETLGKGVLQRERVQSRRPGLSTPEKERLKELGRENWEVRQANDSLRMRQHISSRQSWTADRSDGRSSMNPGPSTETSRSARCCRSLRPATTGSRLSRQNPPFARHGHISLWTPASVPIHCPEKSWALDWVPKTTPAGTRDPLVSRLEPLGPQGGPPPGRAAPAPAGGKSCSTRATLPTPP